MSVMKIGIVGISGYGGSELLRLCLSHPGFELAYAAGESTAGQSLAQRFPALAGHPAGALAIQPFEPDGIRGIDLLFASLPTGKSREPLARVPRTVKVLDVGGDHRFAEGWVYGLTELPGQREKLKGAARVANPGCYPAAALLALAPLVRDGLVEPEGIVIDAKSGVTGTGRGSAADFGYVETSEDLFAYGLATHPHVPEMREALTRLAGRPATLAFTPHLVPMTRGILATCYARPLDGAPHPDDLRGRYADFYADHPFVEVVERPPGMRPVQHTNYAQVCPMVDPRTGRVTVFSVIDNLGKGAAGQAVQNLNLMAGRPEAEGLR